MRTSSRTQSTRRMRAWTSPDFRRRLSVAERSCTTTARLSERPAPDASFPAVNFNGQRFVPSATEGRIVETSLRGSVRVELHKGKFIRWPRAETPTHYITLGLNTDLEEAARMAVREMIEYLVTERGLTRDDAYNLCSQAVDLRVTQLVDGVKGIHAMIPKSIFR